MIGSNGVMTTKLAFEDVEEGEFVEYHNGNTLSDTHRKSDGRPKALPIQERAVIAWDMEGMSLSGMDMPQHAVLFGCSAEPEKVLWGSDLQSLPMLDYILDVSKRNPGAIHVGYGFRYDANMLIKDLPEPLIIELWKTNRVRFADTAGFTWRITLIPGKKMTISKVIEGKRRNTSNKVACTIYDYSSFFGGKKFIDAAETILKEGLTEEDRAVIEHGKKERGQNTWDQIDDVEYYWKCEIGLIQRVFERFRDVMCQAGFALKEWYGPGALANYIIASRGMRPHMAGAQITSGIMPEEVHTASKHAFFGGRFELFKAGRTKGPIYAVDINSAYPYALTMVPSLAEDSGEWRHTTRVSRIERFGFYRISYMDPGQRPIETRPMPLPYRNHRGMVTFPNIVAGWYASPEAQLVKDMPGVTIHEGWYWKEYGDVYPWGFLSEMFDTRIRIGKDNPMSMAFKLGPNSLYGKLAQTVGWDKKRRLPPKSHALPIAAWITSYCRAMLYTVMARAGDNVVAVETDSVFLTVLPESIGMVTGDGLGQWGVKVYDEIMYVQSGMYHTKRNGSWTGTRSRGLHTAEYSAEMAERYLRSLVPDVGNLVDQKWEPLHLSTKPRFIGAGAAIASSRPFKEMHCVWAVQERQITLGENGKRRHVPRVCPACRNGTSAWTAPHSLVINRLDSDGETLSFPRRLPWEAKHPLEVEQIRSQLLTDEELLSR